MTVSVGVAKVAPIPSVADAKRQLSAWGDATDVRVADLRSRAISGTTSIAMMVGIAAVAVFAARRLLPARATAFNTRLDRASGNGLHRVSSGSASATPQSSIRSGIGWMIVTRVGRWLLPHAMQAVRGCVTVNSQPSGRQPPLSVQ